MLKASNIELPKQILAHGWWTSSGAKMSKSTGESVNPLELVEEYGADIFRFFVMREMKVGARCRIFAREVLSQDTERI